MRKSLISWSNNNTSTEALTPHLIEPAGKKHCITRQTPKCVIILLDCNIFTSLYTHIAINLRPRKAQNNSFQGPICHRHSIKTFETNRNPIIRSINLIKINNVYISVRKSAKKVVDDDSSANTFHTLLYIYDIEMKRHLRIRTIRLLGDAFWREGLLRRYATQSASRPMLVPPAPVFL